MSRPLSRRAWTRGWTLCLAWMASLLMAACGGGGGGGSDDPTVRLDRSSITIDYEAGGPMVPARVTATLDDNGYDGAVYIDAVADGPGISQVLLNFSSDGSTAYADIYVDTSLAPGTYTGTLQVFACKDLACRDPLSGSPYRVSFTVNIQAGLSVTPTSSRLTVQSGESAAQSFNVQLQSGASSFTVESLPAWAELVSQDAGSFTLRTRSMPAGVYTGYPVVRAGDRSASLLLELVSNAPSGGEQNLSVSPTSIDFSTTEGGEAVRDLTVTAPSWNPTLTHDVSYTGGAANGWLQVLPTSTGYRLTAQAAGLPAGSYSARMVISGDISTTAQTVYVSLTVGPGLVQVAPRSLEFTSETAADALTGSATIALGAGPTRTWSATSNQSWLVLDTASGSTGSALTYHVDASALAAQANGSTRNAQVTVTAAGVITPMTFDVTVTKRLTQLLYASPSVRQAGLAQTILVSGSGFNAVSDLAARVGVAGVSGVTVTRVSDTQLSLALPSLAAGQYNVQVTHASGLPASTASFHVLASAAAPAARIAQTGIKRALLLDAPRKAVLLLNGDLGQIQRWSWASGSWVSTGNQAVAGLNGIGLSPDGNTLVASSSAGEVQLLDPATLELRTRHANSTNPLYMGASDWTLPVTNDGRVWLSSGSGWNSLITFDLAAAAFTQPDLGSLFGQFYFGPWGFVSGNAERLLLTQSNSITPAPPMLFADMRNGQVQTAPLTETASYRAVFNEDASRLVLDSGKVVDGNFGTVANIVLPNGHSPAAAAFAPDGRKLYVLGVTDSFYAGTSLPTVWVLDSSAAQTGTTQLPVLGSFDLAESYSYVCNWQGGGDTGCLSAPLMKLSPDGRTLVIAGPTALLSVPIPDTALALKTGRSAAQRVQPGSGVRSFGVQRWLREGGVPRPLPQR